MPLYDYKCPACNKVTEVRHGFGESYSSPCPECGGKLDRVFNPAPIVFKGSGFYVNDSRGKTAKLDAPKSDAPKSDAPQSDSSKSDAPAKPAADTQAKDKPAKDPAA